MQVFMAGAGAKQKDLAATAEISFSKKLLFSGGGQISFVFVGHASFTAGATETAEPRVWLGEPGAYIGHIACKDVLRLRLHAPAFPCGAIDMATMSFPLNPYRILM